MTKPRVLVAEDNAIVRMLIVETLTDAGYQVEEAATADVAADLIGAVGYKLLVTDVHMPGRLNGIELAKLAHDQDPAISVVVITGRPDLLPLHEAGLKETFLTKPFTLDQLVIVVGRHVSPESA